MIHSLAATHCLLQEVPVFVTKMDKQTDTHCPCYANQSFYVGDKNRVGWWPWNVLHTGCNLQALSWSCVIIKPLTSPGVVLASDAHTHTNSLCSRLVRHSSSAEGTHFTLSCFQLATSIDRLDINLRLPGKSCQTIVLY